MVNSNAFLGIDNISDIKLGLQSGKLYLGETLLYPLEKPIGDAVVTCDSATYNGSNQVAQNIVVTLSGVTLVAGTDYTVTSNTGGTNVGTYPIVITGAGEYTGTTSGTFTIGKVTPTVTAPTAKVLTYNTQAQELVNAGSTDFGTLKYSLDNSTWSTSVPTATNYGSYTVYYKVDGDSNINNVAAQSVACSINEKQVTATVELSQSTYTYNGSACQPTVTVKDGTVVIDPSEYTVTYSNNVNAGTATVTISDNVGGNYEVIGSTTFTINKVTPTVTAPTAKSVTYNGSSQALVNAASTNWGTLKYSTDGTNYSTAIPSGTTAGSYTVYYKVDGDSNINSVTAQNISVTIAKAVGSVTTAPVNNNYTYNGTARSVASAGSGTGTMYYRLGSSGSFSTTMPTMTDAGSNTLYYYAAASANYEQSSTGSITVSVQKANISPTVSISNWTYGGTASNPSVAGNSGSGTVTYYYKLSSASSWSTTKPSNAGSYNIRADIAATTNYNSGTCTNNFTINKANSSLSFSVTNIKVKVGETNTNVVTVNAGDGTVTYSSNNTSIVTVNNSGVVTGVSTGNTTVSANISSTNNYNSATTSYSASCVLPIIITAKFNVTSTINTTKIADNTSSFTRIEIDGVIQPSVTSGYTFSTTGEHTVKYYLDDTRIGNRAFTNCSDLTSIDIPDEVTSIGDTAFGGCGLKRINSNTNGVFNIPNGVTRIGNYVFSECNGLVNVNIHNRLTSIGNGAFSGCANLTSVIIPDSVETINNYAFSSCTSLTSCTINGYVSSYAFERCSSLRTVTVGAGTTNLNSYVFYLCNSISSITSLAMTAPTTKSDTFRNMSERGTLYIPTGSSGYNTWKIRLGTYWTIVEQ